MRTDRVESAVKPVTTRLSANTKLESKTRWLDGRACFWFVNTIMAATFLVPIQRFHVSQRTKTHRSEKTKSARPLILTGQQIDSCHPASNWKTRKKSRSPDLVLRTARVGAMLRSSTPLATDEMLYIAVISYACAILFPKFIVFRVRVKFILRELSLFVFLCIALSVNE
jgi:hypothetical protein